MRQTKLVENSLHRNETLVILIMKFAFTCKMYIKLTRLYFFAFVHMDAYGLCLLRTLDEKLE